MRTNTCSTPRTFDFDEWSLLARRDPAAFEARRAALIEDFLSRIPTPGQRRLRGLQFRIDMERRRARTPMAACLRLSSLMWDSLVGARGLRNALATLRRDASTPGKTGSSRSRAPTTAHILPFLKPAR